MGNIEDDAVVWRKGEPSYLPKINTNRSISCEATGINDKGEIVGKSQLTQVLWQNGKSFSLRSLLQSESDWTMEIAQVDLRVLPRINNRGQIIGSTYYRGRNQAFLMTPL